MDVPFRVKRYRGTQPADPRPQAVCSAPVHSRELAPNRIDGLSTISSVRPQVNLVSPNPLPAPTILPRRSQVFLDQEPPPAPSFISSRRSQPYPSSCEQDLSADASNPLSDHPLPSVFSPLRGSQSRRTRSSPQSASQQHVEFRQRRLAEQVFEQVCSLCMSFSLILSKYQPFELQSDFLPLLIRKYRPNTIKRYCVSFLNLTQWLCDLSLSLHDCSVLKLVDVLRLMHAEWSQYGQDEDEPSLSPLISLNTLKALRWVANVLQLQIIDLYSPIFSNLTFSSREKRESFPFPLYLIHDLELSLMEGHLSLQDRVFRGSLLVCIWASLRFNDAQHVFWDKILLDTTSLRASCFQAKSSKTGYPFAVQCLGLISETHLSSWLLKWLETLNEIWDASVARFGPSFVPDHLFPLLDASGSIVEPMSYAQTIAQLRRYMHQIPSLQSCTCEYTLHSAKATLLSWACQLHLNSDSRSLQGHHKTALNSSVNLYSRDSVHAPLKLQSDIRSKIIHDGFRPATPLHRGAQSPVIEPAVTLFRQTQPFPLSFMQLNRFHILFTASMPSFDHPIEVVESPVDDSCPNHVPSPDLAASSLFILTPKLVHFASWTIQSGLEYRGCRFRPKCGSPVVPEAQVSPDLPKEARFCKRKACLHALHTLVPS